MFGVQATEKYHPVEQEDKVGLERIDAQRMFLGGSGNQAMGAKPRQFKTGGASINRAKPGGFKVRKRTLKG
jgi:hypothetical protein